MGPPWGPRPAGPLRAVAGPSSPLAEMKPTGRGLAIFAKYGGWRCLANFLRTEGPFWLTITREVPRRRPRAHTRASG
jgi:hypothetical protein